MYFIQWIELLTIMPFLLNDKYYINHVNAACTLNISKGWQANDRMLGLPTSQFRGLWSVKQQSRNLTCGRVFSRLHACTKVSAILIKEC